MTPAESSLTSAGAAAPSPRSGLSAAGAPRLHWSAWPIVALVRFYQRTLSPVLPVVTLGRCACRFAPTCSHYAIEAVTTHGALRGTGLALWRLARCTPLTAGGFDPVPPRRLKCERAAPALASLAAALPSSLTPSR